MVLRENAEELAVIAEEIGVEVVRGAMPAAGGPLSMFQDGRGA